MTCLRRVGADESKEICVNEKKTGIIEKEVKKKKIVAQL